MYKFSNFIPLKLGEKFCEKQKYKIFSCKQRWSYLPTPPLGQDMTQGQFLSEV